MSFTLQIFGISGQPEISYHTDRPLSSWEEDIEKNGIGLSAFVPVPGTSFEVALVVPLAKKGAALPLARPLEGRRPQLHLFFLPEEAANPSWEGEPKTIVVQVLRERPKEAQEEDAPLFFATAKEVVAAAKTDLALTPLKITFWSAPEGFTFSRSYPDEVVPPYLEEGRFRLIRRAEALGRAGNISADFFFFLEKLEQEIEKEASA